MDNALEKLLRETADALPPDAPSTYLSAADSHLSKSPEQDSLLCSPTSPTKPIEERVDLACPRCAVLVASNNEICQQVSMLRQRLREAEDAHRAELQSVQRMHLQIVQRLRDEKRAAVEKLGVCQRDLSRLGLEKDKLRQRLESKEEAMAFLTGKAIQEADETVSDATVIAGPSAYSTIDADKEEKTGAANLLLPASAQESRKEARLVYGIGSDPSTAKESGIAQRKAGFPDISQLLLKPPGPRQTSFQLLQSKLKNRREAANSAPPDHTQPMANEAVRPPTSDLGSYLVRASNRKDRIAENPTGVKSHGKAATLKKKRKGKSVLKTKS